MYGDTIGRLSITFDALSSVGIGHMIVGMVPLERAGDSGILYMIRSIGLFGFPIAIWLYSGTYTYRRGNNVAFFLMIAVYVSLTLMFGKATLSIKTASLLGYLVGIAAHFGRSNYFAETKQSDNAADERSASTNT